MERVIHEFAPVFDTDSRVLVLGTIPSPRSREQGFYYGHPRNRFWKVLAQVFEAPQPDGIEAKKAFLLKHRVAVWDVLNCCEIDGASDSSIKNPIPNDMNEILQKADILAVFTTGSKATALYRKYCEPLCHIPCIGLPSTSPANCRMGDLELRQQYQQIRDYIQTGGKIR
ncbi:MAG: DNA-deoxyinosine glycosylase [Lachnospiraceae bacterium]